MAALRVGLAQGLLKMGEPLKMVAPAVGYGSSAVLTKAFFLLQVGSSPTQWLASTGPPALAAASAASGA